MRRQVYQIEIQQLMRQNGSGCVEPLAVPHIDAHSPTVDMHLFKWTFRLKRECINYFLNDKCCFV